MSDHTYIMKICENCNVEHLGSYASGRFCSQSCSRCFSTKSKRKEINESVSQKLSFPKEYLDCKFCGKNFVKKVKTQTSCSASCAVKFCWTDEDYRANAVIKSKANALKKHESNTSNFGWQSRTKLKASYPEEVAIRFFEENNIEYVRELRVDRFFIDFAFLDKMLAIEIDGQQHNLPERKALDERKDQTLVSLGWKIIRIKWPNDNIRDKLKQLFP